VGKTDGLAARIDRREFIALIGSCFAGGMTGSAAVLTLHKAYDADLKAARARIAHGSQLVATRVGPIEVGISGGQRPLLMIHGTGGGFDQGLQFAQPLIDAGWKVIAPSRFGYLRTPIPRDASSEAEADAHAALLDALGIDRIPVVGGSAGALPALAFALRHRARCSALVPIVPASYVPNRPATPAAVPWAARITEAALQSDFLFWCGLKFAGNAVIAAALATDPEVVAMVSPAEQDRVRRIAWNILPVSRRVQGILNDAKLASHPMPMPLDRIAVPTLTVSVKDDRFGTFAAAQHIAATVPGARILAFETGGHIWAGHDAQLFAAVDDFLNASH
jgi:pimeloyl-ACP methyl ester carboxylesterase